MECVICFEQIEGNHQVTFARCVHGNCVHAQCIVRWTDTCPLCRSIIYDNNNTIHTIINYVNDINHLRNLIEHYSVHHTNTTP